MRFSKITICLAGLVVSTYALAIPSVENNFAVGEEKAEYTGAGGIAILNPRASVPEREETTEYTGAGGVAILNPRQYTGAGGAAILNDEEFKEEEGSVEK